jgi:hypothetical protein
MIEEKTITDKDLQQLSIKEIIDKYPNRQIFVSTPEGMQEIGDIFVKERECVEISTSNRKDSVSEDHMLLSKNGWIYAKDSLGKEVLTSLGFETITSITNIGMSEVYDFEVLHPEHRYYTANGFCSHNCGKTFMILNALREAQKMGYYAIYGDSEAAVDEDLMVKFNIDPARVRYQPLKTVIQTRHFISNLCAQLKEKKNKGFEIPKIMMIIDSLGNLATEKETADALSGSDKRDMTKQQNLKSMFRIITTDLAELKIPLLVTNHVYACLIGETLVKTSLGSKMIKDIIKGDSVLTLDGYKSVTDTFRYDDVEIYEITKEDGTVEQCSALHEFMVRRGENFVWVCAKDLNENDEILKMENIDSIDMFYSNKWKTNNGELISIPVQSIIPELSDKI